MRSTRLLADDHDKSCLVNVNGYFNDRLSNNNYPVGYRVMRYTMAIDVDSINNQATVL